MEEPPHSKQLQTQSLIQCMPKQQIHFLLMPLSFLKKLLLLSLLVINKPSRPRKPLMLLPETLTTLQLQTPLRRKLELLLTSKKLVNKIITHTQLSQDTTRMFSSQKKKCTSPLKPHKTPTKKRLTHSLLFKLP